jgi:hypothetical protein
MLPPVPLPPVDPLLVWLVLVLSDVPLDELVGVPPPLDPHAPTPAATPTTTQRATAQRERARWSSM